jgi:hypothetical protein
LAALKRGNTKKGTTEDLDKLALDTKVTNLLRFCQGFKVVVVTQLTVVMSKNQEHTGIQWRREASYPTEKAVH